MITVVNYVILYYMCIYIIIIIQINNSHSLQGTQAAAEQGGDDEVDWGGSDEEGSLDLNDGAAEPEG